MIMAERVFSQCLEAFDFLFKSELLCENGQRQADLFGGETKQ